VPLPELGADASLRRREIRVSVGQHPGIIDAPKRLGHANPHFPRLILTAHPHRRNLEPGPEREIAAYPFLLNLESSHAAPREGCSVATKPFCNGGSTEDTVAARGSGLVTTRLSILSLNDHQQRCMTVQDDASTC
jgi:hypothetical protein